MKNFRFVSVLLLAVGILVGMNVSAQTRVVNGPTATQGPQSSSIYFGGVPGTPSDSLQVSDSIAYIIPVSHWNEVIPNLQWGWTKIGSGTATITLSFLQNNDGGSTWFNVPKGAAQSAYSKSYTLSATTNSFVDFAQDTAIFSGRYLKVYYITSSTASVKGKLYNLLKVNIK